MFCDDKDRRDEKNDINRIPYVRLFWGLKASLEITQGCLKMKKCMQKHVANATNGYCNMKLLIVYLSGKSDVNKMGTLVI